MKCPNRREHDYDWICLHSSTGDPKDALRNATNGWLQSEEIVRARAMGEDPTVTREKAEEHLSLLEEAANGAYGMWRNTQ